MAWVLLFAVALLAAFGVWLLRRDAPASAAEPELPGGLLIRTLDGSGMRAVTGGPKQRGDAGGAFGGGGGDGAAPAECCRNQGLAAPRAPIVASTTDAIRDGRAGGALMGRAAILAD